MRDHYTGRAKSAGLRARSAYKLMQINQKYQLIRPNDAVLDLGCWPGGWLVVATRKGATTVVGIDLLPIERIQGVRFIQGDVTKAETLSQIKGKFDLVLSDMAPHTSGNRSLDVAVQLDLAETAFKVAKKFLKPGGKFLVKVFQGQGYMEFVNKVKKCFSTLKTLKPLASRSKSMEMYVLGIGFR